MAFSPLSSPPFSGRYLEFGEENRYSCTAVGLLGLECKLTLSSAWNTVRHIGDEFEFHQLIWFPRHSLKMAMCLLRALQMKLLTKDRFTKVGIIQDNVCVLCNTQPETLDHLYFECSQVLGFGSNK